MTDKHVLIIVLIIESIMILLLIIETAIPQTGPTAFYNKEKEYPPEKSVLALGILIEILLLFLI